MDSPAQRNSLSRQRVRRSPHRGANFPFPATVPASFLLPATARVCRKAAMSPGIRVAAWLAWPVFAIIVVFLLLVLVAATVSCTCVDCGGGYNAGKAGAWKLAMSIEA